MNNDDTIQIKRISHQEYRIKCGEKWVSIFKGDTGFGYLDHYFPVFKACHSIACEGED